MDSCYHSLIPMYPDYLVMERRRASQEEICRGRKNPDVSISLVVSTGIAIVRVVVRVVDLPTF